MLSVLLSPFFFLGAIVVLLVLVVCLGYFVISDRHFFEHLTSDTDKKNLSSILESFKKDLKNDQDKITKLEKRVEQEEKNSLTYLQKIGLMRFNPYSDTGGQQSFVLSVLDKLGNGVVISSLFGRNQTRWFAKKVSKNKGEELELSEEEKKVVGIAEKNS